MIWVVVAILLTLFAAWAYFTARRLDRLHIRLDRSRAALQAALDRRCAVLAVTCPELAADAHAVEEIRMSAGNLTDRLDAESALRPKVSGCEGAELQDADTRVLLALRFYNDAVARARFAFDLWCVRCGLAAQLRFRNTLRCRCRSSCDAL